MSGEPGIPPWRKATRQPREWVDIASVLPALKARPYLVEDSEAIERQLAGLGFRVVRADLPERAVDPEEALLVALTAALGFTEVGAGSWAAFNDRLWDLLNADLDEPPVAVLVGGIDRLVASDLHAFVRIVHNLLSMTEGVGLADGEADLQVEYFFVGPWSS
ncbi:hypothetical protein ACIBI4_21280 [Streptomyces sp. NPDC050418]|uniref:hypothetical protein n=1 Tax=Streptomyces sp. NPDC050418 TaxID=3365612 RepID=UPI003794052E